MILAAVDDLMFTSRIRTTAQAVGATVQFAKTAAEAIALARQEKPALVLLDLNARRLDPIAALAQFKSDPQLAEVKVIGFVSHVDTEAITAARSAGIDEVMARSAFTSRLPELLRDAK